MESFGRTPLSQQGPFSGVSLSGEQKKYLNSLIQCNGPSTGNHSLNVKPLYAHL